MIRTLVVVLAVLLSGCSAAPQTPVTPSPAATSSSAAPVLRSDDLAQYAQFVAASLLGMPEADALAAVASVTTHSLEVRVVERDGEKYILTDDIKDGRINLTITKGVVSAAHAG
jgi:PBP1b-binding outer membrane lipoprotein LpoB